MDELPGTVKFTAWKQEIGQLPTIINNREVTPEEAREAIAHPSLLITSLLRMNALFEIPTEETNV